MFLYGETHLYGGETFLHVSCGVAVRDAGSWGKSHSADRHRAAETLVLRTTQRETTIFTLDYWGYSKVGYDISNITQAEELQ